MEANFFLYTEKHTAASACLIEANRFFYISVAKQSASFASQQANNHKHNKKVVRQSRFYF
jgi:hypothetical protein